MAKAPKSDFAAGLATTIAAMREQLNQGRAKIAALKAAYAAAEIGPVTLDMAMDRLDQRLAATAADFEIDSIMDSLTLPADRLDPRATQRLHVVSPHVAGPYFAPHLNSIFAAILGDLVKAKLCAALKAEYAEFDRAGVMSLTDEARAELLRKLDAEILELERAEEDLISEAEAAGISIDRRADADPRALLGVTE